MRPQRQARPGTVVCQAVGCKNRATWRYQLWPFPTRQVCDHHAETFRHLNAASDLDPNAGLSRL